MVFSFTSRIVPASMILLRLQVVFLFLCCRLRLVSALSADHAEITRGRLSQAFASPSGKLTISPEIVIPEPSDPTAILLQTNAVQSLSERIRACKANAAFVKGSLTSLQTFSSEQEAARGNFPGPVPVVYCGAVDDFQQVAQAGADGVVVEVCGGKGLESLDELGEDEAWQELCKLALKHGIQPIPEVTLGEEIAERWSEDDMDSLISQISTFGGFQPVSVLVTINPSDDEQEEPVALPSISRELARKTPVLGSVRVTAGENRLSDESGRFKEAGFTGAFLRSDCVPGFRMNTDLDIVGKFWSLCIEDLKSTRSKSFSFRSKNNMDKNLGTKWANYQNSVMESGALGDPNESFSIVDEGAGEYKGFA